MKTIFLVIVGFLVFTAFHMPWIENLFESFDIYTGAVGPCVEGYLLFLILVVLCGRPKC